MVPLISLMLYNTVAKLFAVKDKERWILQQAASDGGIYHGDNATSNKLTHIVMFWCQLILKYRCFLKILALIEISQGHEENWASFQTSLGAQLNILYSAEKDVD